jgi:hypothetical protein
MESCQKLYQKPLPDLKGLPDFFIVQQEADFLDFDA